MWMILFQLKYWPNAGETLTFPPLVVSGNDQNPQSQDTEYHMTLTSSKVHVLQINNTTHHILHCRIRFSYLKHTWIAFFLFQSLETENKL